MGDLAVYGEEDVTVDDDGWSVPVTGSEMGGVRFEMADVEFG